MGVGSKLDGYIIKPLSNPCPEDPLEYNKEILN